MAAASIGLMTFEALDRLPDSPGFRYELRQGELIKVALPKKGHFLIRRQLRQRLEAAAGDAGLVDTEIGFRATPEHEYRIADVAFVSRERWREIAPDGNLQGAPELTIEVFSPSNTASEMLEKEQLCLENGALEFWVVDPALRRIKVSTFSEQKFYSSGEEIPLFFGGSLPVDDIFSDAGNA